MDGGQHSTTETGGVPYCSTGTAGVTKGGASEGWPLQMLMAAVGSVLHVA
jgi:hypothetical protein